MGSRLTIENIIGYFSIYQGKKILLADTDNDLLDLETSLLMRKGVFIYRTNSAIEILDIHKNENVDLIILSSRLIRMGGEEVLTTIRADKEELKHVSIILLLDNPEDMSIFQIKGVNEYIEKPLNPNNIVTRLLPYVSRLLTISPRKQITIPLRIEENDRIDPVFPGRTVNISKTGMLIETNRLLRLGTSLHITFPHTPYNGFMVQSTVVREGEIPKDGVFRYGLSINELSTSMPPGSS